MYVTMQPFSIHYPGQRDRWCSGYYFAHDNGRSISLSPSLFSPVVAGIGTHTIKYTFTSNAAGLCGHLLKTIQELLDTASLSCPFSNLVVGQQHYFKGKDPLRRLV